ncbi:MAG TPA: SLOG family protein [Prosthecobacter sp.]
MKLIITGGLGYQFTPGDIASLDSLHSTRRVTEVVSGKAPGADACGEAWARKNGLPVTWFPANWVKHGRTASQRQNQLISGYADAMALFPGGSVTENMRKLARSTGMELFDFCPSEEV